jgi:hypothetical protein
MIGNLGENDFKLQPNIGRFLSYRRYLKEVGVL